MLSISYRKALGIEQKVELGNALDIHETSLLWFCIGFTGQVQKGVLKTGVRVDVGMQNISYRRGLMNMTRLLNYTKHKHDLLYDNRYNASKKPNTAHFTQLRFNSRMFP